MAKYNSSRGRDAKSGRFVDVTIAARERVVSRSSAAYVLSGGRGEAAYRLSQIIDGTNGPYSQRSAKTGTLLKQS